MNLLKKILFQCILFLSVFLFEALTCFPAFAEEPEGSISTIEDAQEDA